MLRHYVSLAETALACLSAVDSEELLERLVASMVDVDYYSSMLLLFWFGLVWFGLFRFVFSIVSVLLLLGTLFYLIIYFFVSVSFVVSSFFPFFHEFLFRFASIKIFFMCYFYIFSCLIMLGFRFFFLVG